MAGGEELTKLSIPEITEQDIQEVADRLGVTFDQQRLEVLRSNDNFDVLACPGSGKTTLLVAKLAILAKKWSHHHRGICVLSHTNVARREVEQKLAGSMAGKRILSYPHYIGTIHGFVNTFLALPLLRSEGRRLKLIDDDACGRFCHRLLHADRSFWKVHSFLTKNNSLEKTIRNLRYTGRDLALELAGGKLPCGPLTASFTALLNIKNAAANAGLWRFDDMFALAERLLEAHPVAIDFARWRFPAVFVDEAQDTSEAQSRVLARVFPLKGCTVRQRFGDSNQAIYDHGQERARTDAFPGTKIRQIANSQRFHSSIAMKAGPLAPLQQQLVGDGPPGLFRSIASQEAMPHTIFIFKPDSIRSVLPTFARLLVDLFPSEVLNSEQFVARAVGRIGKPSNEADDESGRFPRGLSDYWPDYESELAKPDPRPESLADFVHLAQRYRAIMGDCAPAVTMATKGIVELLNRAPLSSSIRVVRSLKDLREMLTGHPESLRALEHLLWQWCVEARPLSEAEWKSQLKHLRAALEPLLENRRVKEATDFCRWSVTFADGVSNAIPGRRQLSNRYRFPETEPMVEIDLGTIHSAKGQTHTATLVVETFFHGHDIENLLGWLIGDRCGAGKKCGPRRLESMRFLYTAMTRPTHLLCLAMREQALTSERQREGAIDALKGRGWEVRLL